MTEDFSGFRNFFTLNFIAKPIYNAYLMASKLGDTLLKHETNDENLSVIPTKTTDGGYAILLTYAGENFEEDLPALDETLLLPQDALGKKTSVFLIDRTHTNPYRLAEREKIGQAPTREEIMRLRREGTLMPLSESVCDNTSLPLHLEPNATVLVTLESCDTDK
jgi:beta-xylosidase